MSRCAEERLWKVLSIRISLKPLLFSAQDSGKLRLCMIIVLSMIAMMTMMMMMMMMTIMIMMAMMMVLKTTFIVGTHNSGKLFPICSRHRILWSLSQLWKNNENLIYQKNSELIGWILYIFDKKYCLPVCAFEGLSPAPWRPGRWYSLERFPLFSLPAPCAFGRGGRHEELKY